MSDNHPIPSIPEVPFQNIYKKGFEFEIVTNKEILIDRFSITHDPFRPHRIRYYSILFILEGEGLHYIDFKKYTYRRGSVIFISKEQVHAFEKNMDRKAYFLLFTENFLEKSSLGSNLIQQLSLYNYHLYPPVIQLEENQMTLFMQLVVRLKQEFDAPDDVLTEDIIQSCLKIFLCLAERIRKENRKTETPSRYQEEFLKFQKLLNKNILTSRQVKFYADEMTMSTKKLNRITQEIVNQTAKDYINHKLIIEMKRLLMNTSLSIKEISYQSGFEEPTNFVKYFKKYSGMKPSHFRKSF